MQTRNSQQPADAYSYAQPAAADPYYVGPTYNGTSNVGTPAAGMYNQNTYTPDEYEFQGDPSAYYQTPYEDTPVVADVAPAQDNSWVNQIGKKDDNAWVKQLGSQPTPGPNDWVKQLGSAPASAQPANAPQRPAGASQSPVSQPAGATTGPGAPAQPTGLYDRAMAAPGQIEHAFQGMARRVGDPFYNATMAIGGAVGSGAGFTMGLLNAVLGAPQRAVTGLLVGPPGPDDNIWDHVKAGFYSAFHPYDEKYNQGIEDKLTSNTLGLMGLGGVTHQTHPGYYALAQFITEMGTDPLTYTGIGAMDRLAQMGKLKPLGQAVEEMAKDPKLTGWGKYIVTHMQDWMKAADQRFGQQMRPVGKDEAGVTKYRTNIVPLLIHPYANHAMVFTKDMETHSINHMQAGQDVARKFRGAHADVMSDPKNMKSLKDYGADPNQDYRKVALPVRALTHIAAMFGTNNMANMSVALARKEPGLYEEMDRMMNKYWGMSIDDFNQNDRMHHITPKHFVKPGYIPSTKDFKAFYDNQGGTLSEMIEQARRAQEGVMKLPSFAKRGPVKPNSEDFVKSYENWGNIVAASMENGYWRKHMALELGIAKKPALADRVEEVKGTAEKPELADRAIDAGATGVTKDRPAQEEEQHQASEPMSHEAVKAEVKAGNMARVTHPEILAKYKSFIVNRKTGAKAGKDYDVYVGRPSKFGNPFEIGKDGTRAEVIAMYEKWLRSRPDLMAAARTELKGKKLGCWCAPDACHAEVLAKIANEPEKAANAVAPGVVAARKAASTSSQDWADEANQAFAEAADDAERQEVNKKFWDTEDAHPFQNIDWDHSLHSSANKDFKPGHYQPWVREKGYDDLKAMFEDPKRHPHPLVWQLERTLSGNHFARTIANVMSRGITSNPLVHGMNISRLAYLLGGPVGLSRGVYHTIKGVPKEGLEEMEKYGVGVGTFRHIPDRHQAWYDIPGWILERVAPLKLANELSHGGLDRVDTGMRYAFWKSLEKKVSDPHKRARVVNEGLGPYMAGPSYVRILKGLGGLFPGWHLRTVNSTTLDALKRPGGIAAIMSMMRADQQLNNSDVLGLKKYGQETHPFAGSVDEAGKAWDSVATVTTTMSPSSYMMSQSAVGPALAELMKAFRNRTPAPEALGNMVADFLTYSFPIIGSNVLQGLRYPSPEPWQERDILGLWGVYSEYGEALNDRVKENIHKGQSPGVALKNAYNFFKKQEGLAPHRMSLGAGSLRP